MLIFKYSSLNILKSRKLYIPLLFIIALMLFTLMCVFSVRESATSTLEERLIDYDIVVITHKHGSSSTHITNDWVERYALTDFVSDYYTFFERVAGSRTLSPFSTPDTVYSDYQMAMVFNLIAYSDISKSAHFRFENRKLTDGRFALNTDECNISSELAELNNLSVGDYIEIYLFYYNPTYYSFEIVGIYEDYTEEETIEVPMVPARPTGETIIDGQIVAIPTAAGSISFSRNQILTASSSNALAAFEPQRSRLGYDAAVFYARDEKSIFSFVEAVSDSLSDELIALDSAEVKRFVSLVLNKTIGSFDMILIIVCSITVIFGTLIIFYILKSRTYDIGVLRARGLSRIKTAYLLSSEVFIVLMLSFASAGILYFTSFAAVAWFVYSLQDIFARNVPSVYSTFGSEVLDEATKFEFIASTNLFDLAYGLMTVFIFTAVIGFAASLYISRNEPMKTMADV